MIGAATLSLYQSTIGKKIVMASSGVILTAYVFVHMLGNLKIYQGADAINKYAHELRLLGAPILGPDQGLWIARVVLLAAVLLHIIAAYQLTRLDLAARPVRYAVRKPAQETYASRTMRWGGVIILLFIVYHVMHLTLGAGGTPFVYGDVYQNMINGFKNPFVSGFYIVAMLALAFHLQHGVWSMFQTLGLRSPGSDKAIQTFAIVLAWVVAIGNISIPVSVMAGLIR